MFKVNDKVKLRAGITDTSMNASNIRIRKDMYAAMYKPKRIKDIDEDGDVRIGNYWYNPNNLVRV